MKEDKQLRVCVVGAGKRFLSGISYYTLHLVNTLAQSNSTSAILMRHLLPTRLYPGWKRVGEKLTQLEYDATVHVFDGVDWYWLPSLPRALAFLRRECPDVVIFQWWTGTVLHSYVPLMLAVRILGGRVVIEFHEVLDPGEAALSIVQHYVHLIAPYVLNLAHGFVIHSEYDRMLLQEHYNLGQKPVAVIPHGPYNHYQQSDTAPKPRSTNPACCNLLFFGLIRPYKGLVDLIQAFNSLPEQEIDNYRLTVVGESWEGWSEPAELIAQSRYRDRITFVNRYVADEEVTQFFAQADAVILPYHRSSSSGALHIAMSCGLPVVVTHVGGLVEAVTEYEGAITIPPQDTQALQQALKQVAQLRGQHFSDPSSWELTATRYHALFTKLCSHNVSILV